MVDVSHCVATATAEGGTQAGEERTDQQGDEHPQGGPGSDLGSRVSRFFGFDFGLFNGLMGLGVDLVNPLLGFWLSQVGTLSDDLCQVGTVVCTQLAIIARLRTKMRVTMPCAASSLTAVPRSSRNSVSMK